MGVSVQGNLDLVNMAETIAVIKEEIDGEGSLVEKKQLILQDEKVTSEHMKRRDRFRAKDSEKQSHRLITQRLC